MDWKLFAQLVAAFAVAVVGCMGGLSMSKKRLVLASLVLAVSLVTLGFVVPRIYGSTIIRSKSNISNNRTGGHPVPVPIVICASCTIQGGPGKPEEAYLILMDSENGKMFGYSDKAVMGQEAPVYISTFAGVGASFFIEKP